ncbi:5134_t:CDS:2 [Paraglomus brasilianum]|uniref:5134_t:CDS:1 n=1 Tax=Paraglomus brasilianum TaxID=144538 RepID=A0A9N8VNJ6_9GLOM|nr:5134_t:CDS:2 [Paraglomus brasilianum]
MAPTTASNPPFSINGLRAKKKNDLIENIANDETSLQVKGVIIINVNSTSTEIASTLGLATTGLKTDLENRIKLYCLSQQPTINHTVGDASPARRRSGRNFPPPAHQEAVNGNGSEGFEVPTEKPEIQDVPKGTIPQPSVVENSQVTPIPRETQPKPASVSPLESLKSYLMLSSPQRIADNMRQVRGSTLKGKGREGYMESERRNWGFASVDDKKVTDSQSLVKAFLVTEIAIFLYSVIEWKAEAIPNPVDDSYFPGPDLSVLLDWHAFWRPLLNFFAFLVFTPYLLSYIFNFEPSRLSYNPLAFAVAQGAMLAVSSGNFDWSEDVRQYIPDVVVYVGATVVGLFAFYESMLFNVVTKTKA